MPSLSGSLIDVTSAPSDATEVWIRAADGRVSGANVVLEETRRVPVTGGKFTVTVLPGRAHLVVIHAGMSQEHVPLLVQDGMTTIAEAVRLGAADWEEYSPSQAEQIKAEIVAEVAKADTSAQAAKTAQQAAEKARTDTQNALSTKADKVHSHEISDVIELGAVLNSKASTSHTHPIAQVEGLDSALAGKAEATHSHALADVTGLQAALNGKASTSHTHTTAQVTGLDTALAGKASAAEMVAEQQKPRVWPVTANLGAEPAWPTGSRQGDLLLNTQTLELWKIGSGLIAQLSRTSPQSLGAVDFNTLQTSGVWIQKMTRDAQASPNHPVKEAGLLEISAGYDMVFQRFTRYRDAQVYVRTRYLDSWSAWKTITMT